MRATIFGLLLLLTVASLFLTTMAEGEGNNYTFYFNGRKYLNTHFGAQNFAEFQSDGKHAAAESDSTFRTVNATMKQILSAKPNYALLRVPNKSAQKP